MFGNDPLGGEPRAVVATSRRVEPERRGRGDGTPACPPRRRAGDAPAAARRPSHASKPPPPGSKTVTIIDGSSGKSHDVVIPGKADGERGEGAGRPEAAGNDAARRRSRRSARTARGRLRSTPHPRDVAGEQEGLAAHRHHRRRPRHQRLRHRRRARQAAGAGQLSRSRPMAPSSNSWRSRRARKSTKCCCRCRWSRSTIPTTIPARRRC